MTRKTSVAVLTGLVALTVYLLTLCPTIYVRDTPEFVSAAFNLGVAHPPGYPIYCILGKQFSFLPLGSIAFRVNLMSAFFAASAVAVLVLLLEMLVASAGISVNMTVLSAGALIFAFSKVFWNQAVAAEGYTLNGFFALLTLYIAAWTYYREKMSGLYLLAFVYGISLTGHQTISMLAPVFLAFAVSLWRKNRKKVNLDLCFVLLLTGMLIFLYLIIRAWADPPDNWGNPRYFKNFFAHILRWQYGILTRPAWTPGNFLKQISAYGNLLWQQFTPLVLLALPGIWFTVKRLPKIVWMGILAAFLCTSVGLILLLNFRINVESLYLVRVFFIPSFAVVSIWIVLALAWLIALIRIKPAACILVLVPFIPFQAHYQDNDLSQQHFVEYYGRNLLKTMDENSILFATNDATVFSLLYFITVEKKRLDITIYDDSGQLFTRAYGNDYLFLDPVERSRRVIMAQEKIVRTTSRPVYIVYGTGLFSRPGSVYHPEGLIYRWGYEARKKNCWKFYDLREIWNPDILSDYMVRSLIASYQLALGDYYLSIGNKEKGTEYYLRADNTGKDVVWVQDSVGVFWGKQGNTEKAAATLEHTLKISPECTFARNNLGIVYFQQGNYDKAIELYLKGLDEDPVQPGLYVNLGNAYSRKKMYTNAIESYYKALKYDPTNLLAHFGLGSAFAEINRKDEAVKEFQQVLRINPEQKLTHFLLAKLYCDLKRTTEAINEIDDVLVIKPDNADAHNLKGVIFAKSGNLSAAVKEWKTTLSIFPGHPGAIENLRRAGVDVK